MAAQHDITVEIGSTFTLPLTVTGLVLTGASVRMSIRYPDHDGAVLDSEAGGISFVVTPGTNSVVGTIAATATAAYRASLTFDKRCFPPRTIGVYDLEIEEAGGTVTRLLQGRVYLTDESSR